MQVQTTSSPEEFARHAGDWLTRNPAHNNVLLVHALDPNGVPPGQGDPVFAWVTDDAGEVVGASFRSITTQETPWCERNKAVDIPTALPPEMSTCVVSVTKNHDCARALDTQGPIRWGLLAHDGGITTNKTGTRRLGSEDL